jgi:putative endonuclease
MARSQWDLRFCLRRLTMIDVETMAEIRLGWLEKAIAGLDRLAVWRGRTVGPAHLVTGTTGEDAALFYLRRKGYTVVARRWKSSKKPGDIDLIAWHGPVLCFIEVKTRTAHGLAPAEFAVDSHKRRVLRQLARQYVLQLPQPDAPPVRFDTVSVYLVPNKEREFVHFEDAFGWRERREYF